MRLLAAAIITSTCTSQMAMPAFIAQAENTTVSGEEQVEEKTGVEITKVKESSSYIDGAKCLMLEEIDKWESTSKDYANAIEQIVVNGVEYKKYTADSDAKSWEMSSLGLRIYDGAFREGNNEILIKADGYKEKKVVFHLSNGVYTFVSQEDISAGTGGETQEVNKEDLQSKINEAESIEQGDKTQEAFDTLKRAIEAAKAVLNKTDATQEEVNTATNILQTAVDAFKNSDSSVVDPDQLEDGEYTLSFTANTEGSSSSSMLQGAFDPKVKLVVEEGKMKISMLNTALAKFLLDFSIESNGEYPEAECVKLGDPDINGDYSLQEFTMPISDLEVLHKGAVLVTAMGGQISDLGNYEKYTKLDITFGEDIQKGWTDYQYNIDNANNPEGEAVLVQVLCDLGYDTNGDGQITPDEVQAISGDLNLSHKELTDVSLLKNLSDKVTSIDLSGNKISVLPAGLLDKATNITKFYAQSNLIKDIPDNFFKNNSKLETVYLSSNLLTSVDDNDFTGLSSATEVSVSNNRIAIVSENAFEDLVSLTSLDLSGNRIIDIPDDSFRTLTKMTSLFAYQNNLTSLPKSIEKMTSLEWLSFEHNQIVSIENVDFSKLNNLAKVNLESNRITEIKTGTFEKNENLSYLNLCDNDLTSFSSKILSESISEMNLDLQLNHIDSIDDSVKKLIGEGRFNPQKSVANLKAEVDENKSVTWSQDLSLLDLLYWYDSTTSYMVDEITSVDEYKEMLEKEFPGKNIVEILDEKGYDWDIKMEIQKKNAQGEYVTVKSDTVSEIADVMKGTYQADAEGTYRVLKTIYPATYGVKDYKFSVVSNEVVVEAAEEDTNVLQDGKYTLTGEMYKTNRTDYSMANNAINHTTWLEVKDGEYYLTIQFKGMKISNQFGYLQDLSYYDEGYVIAENGKIDGTLLAAEVLTTQKDTDGNDIVDEYNDKDHLYPELVKIKLVDKGKNEFVPLQVFVPIMDAIAAGTGDQDVLLKLDWSSLEKNEDGNIDTEKPEEQSPAIDVVDKETGVKVQADKGVFAENAVITVDEILSGKEYETIQAAVSEAGELVNVFQIVFADDQGNRISPNGTVDISFPILSREMQQNYKVYRINDDGTKTLVNGTLEGGYYTITTKTDGTYALVKVKNATSDENNQQNDSKDEQENTTNNKQENTNVNNNTSEKKEETGTPETGDPANVGMLLSMLGISGAAIIGAKKKNKSSKGE